jgi:hypothetical protein
MSRVSGGWWPGVRDAHDEYRMLMTGAGGIRMVVV